MEYTCCLVDCAIFCDFYRLNKWQNVDDQTIYRRQVINDIGHVTAIKFIEVGLDWLCLLRFSFISRHSTRQFFYFYSSLRLKWIKVRGWGVKKGLNREIDWKRNLAWNGRAVGRHQKVRRRQQHALAADGRILTVVTVETVDCRRGHGVLDSFPRTPETQERYNLFLASLFRNDGRFKLVKKKRINMTAQGSTIFFVSVLSCLF